VAQDEKGSVTTFLNMPVAEPSPRVRILLVDDHPVMRAGVRSLLGGESDLVIVDEASDGISAVRVATEQEFDVVIMDVSLPELGGAKATQKILESSPGARVLALSAHDELSFVRLMLDSGAAGYVLKRSACDELVRAVRTVASGNSYLDPTLAANLVPASAGRQSTARSPVTALSEREAEVIRMIARGHTAKEMAAELQLSPRTLETYKARAMSKLNLRSRADLIRYALRSGWLRDS
jgi:DNA-binding NarL/FixJ family response regulator